MPCRSYGNALQYKDYEGKSSYSNNAESFKDLKRYCFIFSIFRREVYL